MSNRINRLLAGLTLTLLLIAPNTVQSGPPVPAMPELVTTTIVLEASEDGTLYSESGSIANGAGQHFFAGTTGGNQIRRAVLAFGVSGSLPAGARVITATLQLNLSRTSAGPETVNVHRLTSGFSEGTSDAGGNEGQGTAAVAGDATWLFNSYPTFSWNTRGGDFEANPSASQLVGSIGTYTWASPRLTSDVQWWLDNQMDLGWILVGNEAASTTSKRFDSRQNPTAANRPKLTIIYASTPSIFLPQISAASTGGQ